MSKFKILDVEITSASVNTLLTQCNNLGIELFNIRYLDDLKVRVNLSGYDFGNLNTLVNRRGDLLRVIDRKGLLIFCKNYLNRPILLVGVILWLAVVLYLPTRVLFLQVEGNQIIDTVKIIEAAEKCGIRFGASRKIVRSEKVKNELLSEIDALQWAGVNTFGCVAVISVKERAVPIKEKSCYRFNSITAERDAIITEMTVTRGTPLCKVGQAVREGQVLVSGFTDCGLHIRGNNSEAEIRGVTNRQISAITPLECVVRGKLSEIKSRYSIQIGKNVVKLHSDSGIGNVGCVKIYKKYSLTLPGGFGLPISFMNEISYSYDCVTTADVNEDQFTWTYELTESYVLNKMVAGRILRGTTCGTRTDDAYCIDGSYICEEAIGTLRTEEIGDYNGKGKR